MSGPQDHTTRVRGCQGGDAPQAALLHRGHPRLGPHAAAERGILREWQGGPGSAAVAKMEEKHDGNDWVTWRTWENMMGNQLLQVIQPAKSYRKLMGKREYGENFGAKGANVKQ